MCRPALCKTCRKTTWAGCGQHIADVRAVVPGDQWCPGHTGTSSAPSGGDRTGGLLRRLLGR